MEALIDGLLNYSRLSRPQKLEMTDFATVLQEVLHAKMGTITSLDAQVKVGPMPALLAYPDQIRMLFDALLSNALKFCAPSISPVIEIQSGESSEGWTFLVRDNGIGIPKKDQDKVFAIFKRIHDPQKYPGIGIGLANCQKIVEQHGGRIWVESEEGSGSIFYFTLPAK